MSELTLRGGTIVTPGGMRRADLGVRDGVIRAVGDLEPVGAVVDATGLLVLPGMVDTHVHLMDPGPTEREDFPTGTRAAAARGVTTIVEHTHAHPVRTVADLEEKRGYLQSRANVDYGLAAHVWPNLIGELPSLWEAGISFFKIFTCTTHGVPGLAPAELLAALRTVASFDGRCLIHCEDESITAEAERALKAAGRADSALLIEWRNREAELVAVAATAVLAQVTGAKVSLAHVSSPDVVEVVESARRRGADIAAEACPQYFVLDESEVFDHGALRKFTPPARIRSEKERDRMWEAVRSGAFSHFSTDHAPATIAQKQSGDIWEAPFGLPGLDTTLPFLLDAALAEKIDLPTLVRLYAQAPAARYGLSPRKGTITEGADADLVLVDPEARWTVTDGDVISKAGWTPYAGTSFRGRVEVTYLRGLEIARAGSCHDERVGRFLHPRGAAGS